LLTEDSSPVCVFTVSGSPDSSPLYSESLEHALAADLSVIQEINFIFVERAEGNLLVWVSVENPVAEVRERIFQKQYDLIEGFPEISFDFNLILGKGNDPKQYSTSSKIIYTREG